LSSAARWRNLRAMSDTTFTAKTADRHRLYELSVQDTEVTIELIDTIFAHRSSRAARSLREDFCGTAQLCVDWILSDPARTAAGLDIDRPTLDWAKEHNVPRLGADVGRLTLLERDVLEGTPGDAFDVVCAFNFSYFAFQERASLLAYFSAVNRDLAAGGVLLLDLHGGPDAQFTLKEATEFDGFDYVWEQASFDPISNRTICHIHFRFDDGTVLDKAFTYDWRVWSIPELREILTEAGFARSDVWWEGQDEDEHHPAETAENLEAWLSYIAAWK
jgi:SAM-dependent methyltransferase